MSKTQKEMREEMERDIATSPDPVGDYLSTSAYPKSQIKNVVGNQYKHLKIDTVARSKANHTPEQQKAICIFQVDKYLNREKGQDKEDIIKIRFYLDWLEEIING